MIQFPVHVHMVTLETDTNAGNVLPVVIMTQPAYSAKQDPFAYAKKVITAMVELAHTAELLLLVNYSRSDL